MNSSIQNSELQLIWIFFRIKHGFIIVKFINACEQILQYLKFKQLLKIILKSKRDKLLFSEGFFEMVGGN